MTLPAVAPVAISQPLPASPAPNRPRTPALQLADDAAELHSLVLVLRDEHQGELPSERELLRIFRRFHLRDGRRRLDVAQSIRTLVDRGIIAARRSEDLFAKPVSKWERHMARKAVTR